MFHGGGWTGGGGGDGVGGLAVASPGQQPSPSAQLQAKRSGKEGMDINRPRVTKDQYKASTSIRR